MNRPIQFAGGVISGSLLVAPRCVRGAKEDVASATAKWAATLERTIPTRSSRSMPRMPFCGGRCLPRYAPIGCLARLFCKSVCRASRPQGDFWEQRVRIYGNTAVNTGYYTFSFVKDGGSKDPARSLQLHLRKEGRNVAGRGSSLIGHARRSEVA